jgi:hypothetical protein
MNTRSGDEIQANLSAQPKSRSSEQSVASTVPSHGRWRSGSYNNIGSADRGFDTTECIITAQNSGTIPP